MTEPKRVAFTTISSSVSTVAGNNSATAYRAVGAASSVLNANKSSSMVFGANLQNEGNADHAANHNKTFRLELTLFQTDCNKYPEFNYARLVHLEKKKLKKLKGRTNGISDDPLVDGNDDDVARIARELEKKYGTAYGSGRSRPRKNECGDKGMGYDETDSFIDNSEAYDEVIPEEVETVEGGFYINCGALEFKKLQTELTTTKTDEIIKMPNRPKKRELSTSSSEDSSTTEEDDEADDDEEEDEEEGDDSSTTNNRQKSGNSSSSTTSVHKKKSKTVEKNEDGTKQIGISSSSSSPKPIGEEHGSDSDKDRVPIKTITVKEMLKAKRDNYFKSQSNEANTNANGQIKGADSRSSNEENDNESTTSTDDSEDSDDSADSAAPAVVDKKLNEAVVAVPITGEENTEKQEVKLPTNLNVELLESVRAFKDGALSKGMLGKKFQFEDRTILQFLNIDNMLVKLDKTQRSLVLAYLEFHLQLPKYYFLRKAKQLRIKEEKLKSKRALAKLKKAVIEAMPSAIAQYEVELRKCADSGAGHMYTEQPPVMPKKEFSWNNNLRILLYEVYEVRVKSYAILRTRKETLEEFVNEYLRSKVIDVWPNGWMRLEELQREVEKTQAMRSQLYKENKKKDVSLEIINPKENHIVASTTMNQCNLTSATIITTAVSAVNPASIVTTTTIMSTITTTSTTTVATTTSGTSKRKMADGTLKARKNKSQRKDKNSQITSGLMHMDIPVAHKKSTVTSGNEQQQQQTMNIPHSASAFSAFQQQMQQQPQHSMPTNNTKSAHVIDLDNYKNTNDILQTSKQLINAAVAMAAQQQPSAKLSVYDSSSESDGVEIVGVYQNKPKYGKTAGGSKQKHNAIKNMDTLGVNLKTPTSKMYTSTTNSGNAVNYNNNYNKMGSSKSGMDTLDVNKVLKDLKGLEQLNNLPTAVNMGKSNTQSTRSLINDP